MFLFFDTMLFLVILGVLIPAVLMIRILRKRAKRIRREEVEARNREYQEADKKWREEGLKKAEMRKKWLAENSPKLYFNTVNGITAVVVPSEYERMIVETRKAIRDERWAHTDLLMPITQTFLFVNAKGRASILEALETIRTRQSDLCGLVETSIISHWLSEFDEYVEVNHLILEQKTDIFVPFVNESVLSFDKSWTHHYASEWRSELMQPLLPSDLK